MNRSAPTRTAVRFLVAVVVALSAFAISPGDASALSPNPNANFWDSAPGSPNYNHSGVIVEGLGLYSCSYSLSSLESGTIASLNSSHTTLAEISPQSGCATIAQYETAVKDIENYVSDHLTKSEAYWGGVILDEEPDFGFSYSQLHTLNGYVGNLLTNNPYGGWWFTNLATYSGYWTQAQYTDLTVDANGDPAPQVYTNFEASAANGAGFTENMVTTWSGAPSPYNTASYAWGKIDGNPFEAYFGFSSVKYWTWPYTSA